MPPTVVAAVTAVGSIQCGSQTEWPTTQRDDWCGKFEDTAADGGVHAEAPPAWRLTAMQEFAKAMDLASRFSQTVDVSFDYGARDYWAGGDSVPRKEHNGQVTVMIKPAPAMPAANTQLPPQPKFTQNMP